MTTLKGTTIISHDSEAKMVTTNCVGPGCYSKDVSYMATMKQMKALMEISKECQQLIKVKNILFISYLDLYLLITVFKKIV